MESGTRTRLLKRLLQLLPLLLISISARPASSLQSPVQSGALAGASPNQAPDPPVLIAPGLVGTIPGSGPSLAVSVSDSGRDDLTVTFFGREVPAPAPDFTIVAIPDTQNYTSNSSTSPLFTAQTRWIVDSRSALNTAFVTHLGDITDHGDLVEAEWSRADASLALLDACGIPYNLSPGNHDLSATGVSELYDKYFPVGRYLGRPWYGGYLGSDPGDLNRKNKNNFELFSVGGLDFIVVHLEPDLPAYAMAWADRILKQYSSRRAIISTHIFLDPFGTRSCWPEYRPDGTSAEGAWQQLIRTNCNIFLVLNGHYHGEARRTDLNECGQPVHQVLQDYQDRDNGGDGWLRYFTFRPSENRIDAYTYSPSRSAGAGEFETDADSQFTLNYDMLPSGFSALGGATVPSGSTVSIPWSKLAPGATYEWYVTVSNGQATTAGPIWTFTMERPAPLPSLTIHDVRLRAVADEVENAAFTVTLSAPSGIEVSVNFATVDGTATAAANDYIAVKGNLCFRPGEAKKLVVVQVNGGSPAGTAKTFHVTLRNPINSTLADRDGICTILSETRPRMLVRPASDVLRPKSHVRRRTQRAWRRRRTGIGRKETGTNAAGAERLPT